MVLTDRRRSSLTLVGLDAMMQCSPSPSMPRRVFASMEAWSPVPHVNNCHSVVCDGQEETRVDRVRHALREHAGLRAIAYLR